MIFSCWTGALALVDYYICDVRTYVRNAYFEPCFGVVAYGDSIKIPIKKFIHP